VLFCFIDEKIVFYSTVVQDELTRPLVIDDLDMSRIQNLEQTNKKKAYMVSLCLLDDYNVHLFGICHLFISFLLLL